MFDKLKGIKIIASLFLLLIFSAFTKLYFEVLESMKDLKYWSSLDLFENILRAPSLFGFITALLATSIAFYNFLRKYGNEVEAILGQEDTRNLIILFNRKDKSLVFNSISLLLDGDKYLKLEPESKKGEPYLGNFSNFITIKPYEALTLYIADSPLSKDLFLNESYPSQVFLTAIDGDVVCKKLDILPIEVKSLRNNKKYKMLNSSFRLTD